jgi:hypothetical protein
MYTKVFLQGGLGNQLFQLNFARQLKKNNFNVVLDTVNLSNRNLEIPLEILDIPVTKSRVISRKAFDFLAHKNLLPNVVFENRPNKIHRFVRRFLAIHHIGYYQDCFFDDILPITFSNYEEHLFSTYSFAENLSQSIAIHIRGGDYFNSNRYEILDAEYFVLAIKKLNPQKNSEVFIFSDDIAHSRDIVSKLHYSLPYLKLTFNFIDPSIAPFETLKLFSISKMRVISNSSFSWWGAYIASQANRNTTIYPTKYFRNTKFHLPVKNVWVKIGD